MKQEIKRLNCKDIIRGRIMDEIAEHFGNSVLGLYDKKLRVEIIDEEGNIIQFSIAPVVHKDLIEPSECDEYITTDEKIKMYEESLKKNAPKETKKAKVSTKPKASAKEQKEKIAEVVAAAKGLVEKDFNFDEPVSVSNEEQSKLDNLMNELGL